MFQHGALEIGDHANARWTRESTINHCLCLSIGVGKTIRKPGPATYGSLNASLNASWTRTLAQGELTSLWLRILTSTPLPEHTHFLAKHPRTVGRLCQSHLPW